MLQGIRIVEIEGLGPGPFAAMMLADLGADVIVVPSLGPSPSAKRGPTAGLFARNEFTAAFPVMDGANASTADPATRQAIAPAKRYV